MRVIDLARQVGLSAQQVRNYEAFGLFPPVVRSASGYRVYTEHHLETLHTVRAMMSAGYSQRQVLEVIQAIRSGDIGSALAKVNAHHALLDRKWRQLEVTLEAIRTMTAGSRPVSGPRRSRDLRIGEAAKVVGVEPSALRFWEDEGLLQPKRDPESRYRLYDRAEMNRLEVVAVLRQANYRFDDIRSVLAELSADKPEAALKAVERRRDEIEAASRACMKATAALWAHINEEHGAQPAFGSG